MSWQPGQPRHPRTILVPKPWESHKGLRTSTAKPQDLNPDVPKPPRPDREAFLAHKAATAAALVNLNSVLSNATTEGVEVPATTASRIDAVAPPESVASDEVEGDVPVRPAGGCEHDLPDILQGTIEVGVRS